MDCICLGLIGLVLILCLHLWGNMKKSNRFWLERGIPHKEPTLFFGNWLPVFMSRITEGDFYNKIYRDFPDEKLVGIYTFQRPILVVKDPALADRILVSDFSHFPNRGVEFASNPIDDGLILMKGKRWRTMRRKLSPVFTSGKIKSMFETAVSCGANLVSLVEREPSKEFMLKDLMSVFTCDIIASCVFGVDLGSKLTPDSEFVQKAKRVFSLSPLGLLKFYIAANVPFANRFIKVTLTAPDIGEYFGAIIEKTIRARTDKRVQRNDFVNLLLQLREQGSVKMESKDPEDDFLRIDSTGDSETVEFTNDLIKAQAYTFLSAGFDTTSTLLQYILFELARNPEIQEKAREEVFSTLREDGGEITYQTLSKMTYLENILRETLRMYPATSILRRFCTKETIIDSRLKVEPGQLVIIPIGGFMLDPDNFPEPEVFRPERFEVEPKKGTYLPFGAGPRICIGMRFALVNVKLGLAVVLSKFKVLPSAKTKLPIRYDPTNFINYPIDSLWCVFEQLPPSE